MYEGSGSRNAGRAFWTMQANGGGSGAAHRVAGVTCSTYARHEFEKLGNVFRRGGGLKRD